MIANQVIPVFKVSVKYGMRYLKTEQIKIILFYLFPFSNEYKTSPEVFWKTLE